jgi:PAS domain S-box-containing protein
VKNKVRHKEFSRVNDELNFLIFFNSSPDLLFVFEPDSIIIEANDTAAGKLGYKNDELPGKSMFDLRPVEKRAECQKFLEEILEGKRSYCPLPLVKKSGEPLFVETRLTKGKWNGRDVIFSVSRDISEQVKTEESARKSEERYKLLFSNSADAVFVHEFAGEMLPGKFIEANDVACKRLGYTREEFLKMSPKDIDSPEGWALIPAMMEKLKADKHAVWEGIQITREGNKIPVEISNHLFEMEGRPVILSTVRDITERKASEEMLRRSEKKYRKIFENVQDLFYQADTDGRITDISPSIEKYSGYRPEELIGKKIDTFYQYPGEREVLLKILSEKGEVEDYIIHLTRKEGKLVYASANIHLLINAEGKVTGVEGSLRDVTERFHAQEKLIASELLLRKQNEEYTILNDELKKAKEKAEESDRLKSAFLANMSHEIRTPMNGIVGFSQMLGDPRIKNDDREAYIKIVNSSCQQLLHIINDIIDISKIEAGQIEISETSFSLTELLREVFLFFLPSAKEKKLELILDCIPSEGTDRIISDRTKLHQIIDNLLSNAIKFTFSGKIILKCRHIDDFLEFHILDTGIGINPEMCDVIYERFRQLENSFSKKHSGTGLGLSISKAYAEKLGGSVGVFSEPDEGSDFFFRIPYKAAQEQNFLSKTEPVIPAVKRENFTILVVEDEEINWLYINEILKKHAIILHAINGRSALEMIRKDHKIDLVLMDIKLPDINGLELTRMIRAENNRITVVAQTAYALAGDREKAIEAGCAEYLTKPIKKEDLLKIVTGFQRQPE